MVFGMSNFRPDKKEFDMATFFGERHVMQMTTLASPKMIVDRLTSFFGKKSSIHGRERLTNAGSDVGRSAQEQEGRVHERRGYRLVVRPIWWQSDCMRR